jgi:hypothetical protein
MQILRFRFAPVALLSAGVIGAAAGAAGAEDTAQALIKDDFYVAGRAVAVSHDVAGDLVAAGGSVTVEGRVAQDALVAGGNVAIDGDIGDVLRVAGGEVDVRGDVGGYLVAGGGNVELGRAATVAGGVFVNAGEVAVNGTVLGPLEVHGGDVRVDGTVNGEVTVHAGRLAVGEHAVLAKGLRYFSDRKVEIAPGARIAGETSWLPPASPASRSPAWMLLPLPALVKVLGLVLTGVALILAFPRMARAFVGEATLHFRRDALLGAAVLLLGPALFVLLAGTVVALPLGVLAGLAYVAFVLLSVVGAGLILGAVFGRVVLKDHASPAGWKAAVVGLALLPAVAWVPVVGWLTVAVLALAALGSLSVVAYQAAREAAAAPAPPAGRAVA